MNAKVSRTQWMRSLGNFSYILAVAFLIASLAVNAIPADTAQAAPGGASGAIWTTTGSCGDPQNVNQYQTGEVVYLNGDGFDEGSYGWHIKGQPGGASGDPGDEVASGTVNVGSSGTFCFAAYTIPADDWGEYSVKVGNKGDNYSVSALTSTPTDAPEDPTATPTNTPEDPTATPTDTPEDPTATPTEAPGDPTATPTEAPGDPTATPTGDPGDPTATPTITPEDPHGTQTTTPSPESLTISSFCGPNSKHVNWWKVANSSPDDIDVTWQIQPGGAPSDEAEVLASGEVEFSTVRVTDSDSLEVYFDPQGQQFAGSADAAQGCSDPGPNATPNPGATSVPSGQAQVLIPVTGADLNTGGSLRLAFFNLGIGFLGLGLVLNGLSRERKNRDL